MDTLKDFIILVPSYPLAQFSCYLIVCVSSQTISSEGVVIVSFLLPYIYSKKHSEGSKIFMDG